MSLVLRARVRLCWYALWSSVGNVCRSIVVNSAKTGFVGDEWRMHIFIATLVDAAHITQHFEHLKLLLLFLMKQSRSSVTAHDWTCCQSVLP